MSFLPLFRSLFNLRQVHEINQEKKIEIENCLHGRIEKLRLISSTFQMNNCSFFIVLSRKENSVVVETFTNTMTYLALLTEGLLPRDWCLRPSSLLIFWWYSFHRSTWLYLHDFFLPCRMSTKSIKKPREEYHIYMKEALWNNLFKWHSIGRVPPELTDNCSVAILLSVIYEWQ